MRKTSVYLPDETKEALRQVSRRWNRSEAQLIREAIDRLVRSATAESAPAPSPSPAPPRANGPQLIGVGVGPSAPDLITRRAVDVLEGADRVFAASTAPDAISRAETIVRSAAPHVAVDRLPFVAGEGPGGLDQSFERAVDTLVTVLDRGEVAAFITLGDPNVYSVFSELARRIRAARPGLPVAVVPGIMAFQELAASTGTVLAEGDERIDVGTMADDGTSFAGALVDARSTVVLYKGGRRLPEVAAQLRDCERLEGAVVGELMGLPGGRNGPVADVADRPASYLATVIVPAKRDDRP
jgi:precorrin-2/cobalt-factor-2 C20-methyltransferase